MLNITSYNKRQESSEFMSATCSKLLKRTFKWHPISLDTERKWNVHKTFRRRPERLLDVLRSFYVLWLEVRTFNKFLQNYFLLIWILLTQYTQDVNWTYIRRSEDVLGIFWGSYVRSIYVLYPRGSFMVFSLKLFAIRNESCKLDMMEILSVGFIF